MVVPRNYDAYCAVGTLRYQKLGKNRRENEDQELAAGQRKILQYHRS